MEYDNEAVRCDECGVDIDTDGGYDPVCGEILIGDPARPECGNCEPDEDCATCRKIVCLDILCEDCRASSRVAI